MLKLINKFLDVITNNASNNNNLKNELERALN